MALKEGAQKFSLQTWNLKESHPVMSERIHQNTHPAVSEALSVMFDKCQKKQKPLPFQWNMMASIFIAKRVLLPDTGNVLSKI